MSLRYPTFVSILGALGAFACDRNADTRDEGMEPASRELQQNERREAEQRQSEQQANERREAEQQRVEQQPAEPQADVPTGASAAGPVNAIASARCDREQRCNNIGADKSYASKTACLERIRAEWQEDLNARECPGGVVADELAECLEEIRNEDCNSPFDSLGRIAACRESDICKAVP